VIAAAGSGERLGAGGPKAFVELAGRPLLDWSLDAFREAALIEEIVVAVPPGEERPVADRGVLAVAGGAHRSESVANAVELCGEQIIVVHDAARPLVTPALINAVIDRLASDGEAAGAIAAAPLTDTIKRADEAGEVERTVDRADLWAVQTPQAFRAEALREALSDPDSLPDATDDAMLVERRGGRVLIQDSPADNLKVTRPIDLRVAELLLGERT
jgi:2-C-methyl-D-erythritol 4-phosphate cytidylyltransferase